MQIFNVTLNNCNHFFDSFFKIYSNNIDIEVTIEKGNNTVQIGNARIKELNKTENGLNISFKYNLTDTFNIKTFRVLVQTLKEFTDGNLTGEFVNNISLEAILE